MNSVRFSFASAESKVNANDAHARRFVASKILKNCQKHNKTQTTIRFDDERKAHISLESAVREERVGKACDVRCYCCSEQRSARMCSTKSLHTPHAECVAVRFSVRDVYDAPSSYSRPRACVCVCVCMWLRSGTCIQSSVTVCKRIEQRWRGFHSDDIRQ